MYRLLFLDASQEVREVFGYVPGTADADALAALQRQAKSDGYTHTGIPEVERGAVVLPVHDGVFRAERLGREA